jgi:hypothetical protein
MTDIHRDDYFDARALRQGLRSGFLQLSKAFFVGTFMSCLVMDEKLKDHISGKQSS